jgi:hypothetical protein
MRKLLIALVAALAAVVAPARDLDAVGRAVENSVYISQPLSGGSGTLFTRTNAVGERLDVVVTAGHVLSNHLTNEFWEVKFDFGGSNTLTFHAKILASNPFAPVDVGVLFIVGTNTPPARGAVAKLTGSVRVGQEIFGVSAPRGERWVNSVSFGELSHPYRRIEGVRVSQSTLVCYPGSSGGGVFTSDGLWIGASVAHLAPGVTFFVPIDTYHAFLCEKRLGWVLDPSIPAPTRVEILNKLIE